MKKKNNPDHHQKVKDSKGKEIKEGMTVCVQNGQQILSEHKIFKGNSGALEYEKKLYPNGIMSCFLSNIIQSLKEGEILIIKS